MSEDSAFNREYRDRATWKKFWAQYIKNTLVCDTYEEAYQLTEEQHKRTYKRRCYSSYNSFRNTKTRKLKAESKQC